MEEEGGFDYRWVYGLDKLSVKITSEGTNWWGQNVKQDILKDYLHQDRLGSTTNLTDKFGRVVGRADYNEWGEITYKDALDITSAYRRIYPQLNYTGHDWDDVLEMYYAKARFYDPDAKRFVEIDPVKGNVTDPLSLVSYLYCVDNPLRWVDPLGLYYIIKKGSTYYLSPEQAYEGLLDTMGLWGEMARIVGKDIQVGVDGAEVVGGNSVPKTKLKVTVIDQQTDWFVEKGFEWQRDTIVNSILEKKFGKVVKDSLGDISTLAKGFTFWSDLQEEALISRVDNAVFNLLSLTGIPISGTSSERLKVTMDTAYAFVLSYDWFFIEPSYVTPEKQAFGGIIEVPGPTAFEVLIALFKMEKDGRSQREISNEIKRYWSDYCCSGNRHSNTELDQMCPTYVPVLSPYVNQQYRVEEVHIYHEMMKKYDVMLRGLAQKLKNQYDSNLREYIHFGRK